MVVVLIEFIVAGFPFWRRTPILVIAFTATGANLFFRAGSTSIFIPHLATLCQQLRACDFVLRTDERRVQFRLEPHNTIKNSICRLWFGRHILQVQSAVVASTPASARDRTHSLGLQ